MRTIQLGSRGDDVQAWQQFLRGGQVGADGVCTASEADVVQTDGSFGPCTKLATTRWQNTRGLTADGVVGPNTWAEAVKDGFTPAGVPAETVLISPVVLDPVDVDDHQEDVDKSSPAWPPRPAWAKPLVSQADRDAVLGKIEYEPAPTKGNPEAVKITNGWAKDNIAKFLIPQLSENPISMHKLAGPQFQAWFQAIEVQGLSDRVFGFAGCWVPRFVRGSRTRLSNHTWGSAIDFAVPYNGRGRQAALVGKKGCVRELAVSCYDFGIFWGGHYRGAPCDGMHWELFKVLSLTELQTAKAKWGVAS